MSVIRRFKRYLRPPVDALQAAPAEQPRRNAYSLSLPNPLGGAPLCRTTVAWTASRHAQGETVRVQAHLDGQLFGEAPPRDGRVLTPGESQRGGMAIAGRAFQGLARRGLSRLPLPQRRLRTWFDVQVSTVPLVGGAEALIPERLRTFCGGGLPRTQAGEPRLGVWIAPANGPIKAQLALLQIDAEDLPADYRGPRFSLAASVATLTEPASSDQQADQ